MELYDLRPLGLFDGLTDDQLLQLITAGAEVTFGPGQDLFVEGTPADSWWVLVDGSIDLVRHAGHDETIVGAMDVPGRWAGGFRAWDEHGVYLATGRGAVAGRVLRVPAADLKDLATAWFPFGTHLIAGLFHTARNIESFARQREALVALGTLAAGLAHEINNPAAAATRAVDALEESCDMLVSSLGRLAAASISADQFLALDKLRHEIGPRALQQDPMAIADSEETLSTWMSRHGVERDWLIAPPLAAAGVDVAWCEQAADVLGGPALQPGLEWVAGTVSTAALLAEVKESTGRVSDLVAAVKSYSQLDRASLQQVDVAEGIESTLVMLAHRIPDGVSVVRDYAADLPHVEAAAGELNQVWTNLIDNAVDAMEGEGTLRVSTRADRNGVVVEIGDTGAGMSAEASAHAFEPFFTTKGVGKGTGLGLDISRRIIDRHSGEISIDLQPGETVLRVHLPLRPPSS
jgi:signal transduction histidine kinase